MEENDEQVEENDTCECALLDYLSDGPYKNNEDTDALALCHHTHTDDVLSE